MASLRRGDASTLSLREKALVKRRITKEHNSNFRAGYVHIDEEQLHKTGIRGRKTYFIYCIAAGLLLLVLINLLLTLTIILTLKMGKDGMASMEFIPYNVLLRFLGDSNMGNILPVSSTIGSLPHGSLDVTGNNSYPIILKVDKTNAPEVSIGASKIEFGRSEMFMVIDPETGRTIFTTDYAENMPMPIGVENFASKIITVNKIASSVNEDLTFEGGESITVRGSEGIRSTSETISMSSSRQIHINGEAGINLRGEEGVYFKKELPLIDDRGLPRTGEVTHKLCVGVPSGQLYIVPSGGSCHDLNS